MEMSKETLIDAIAGKTFDQGPSTVLTKFGYMRFTGNQHYESWEWIRDKLEAQTEERLERIYAAAKRGWLVMSDIRE